jgi:hypothetical protein
MPKIHISDCPSGFVLDAAVAMAQGLHIDNLAGYWKDDAGNHVHPACVGCDGVPTWHPSGDIRAAWPLLEELAEDHSVAVNKLHFWKEQNWVVSFAQSKAASDWTSIEANNGALPLAITHAYLLAHGVTEVEVPAP